MSLELTVVSEGLLNVTFGWTPVPGAIGYYFYKDGVRVSSTADPMRSTIKFRKPITGSTVFSVQAMMPGPQGDITYPIPVPMSKTADPLMPLRGH